VTAPYTPRLLWFAVALAAASTACPTHRPTEGPPPPRGQTMEEYLAEEDRERDPVRAPDGAVPDSMTLHVIDIGQGASSLLEFPCGAVLIDTGGEKNEQFDSWDALRDYLDAFFARRRDLDRTLDLVVVTHPHIDHTRNLEAVLARYRVKNVIDNGARDGEIGIEPQQAMHLWVEERAGQVGYRPVFAHEIDESGLTDAVIDPVGACDRSAIDPEIRALWGGVTEAEQGSNANDHSVVLRVDFGSASFMLSGDIERLAIARMTRLYEKNQGMLDVDVYLVPHHGSRNSTSAHFVRLVRPKVAVISAGPYYRNEDWTARRFGHPHREAINHLLDEEHGVSMRRERPIEAMVGVRGAWKETPSEFEKRVIERAIYVTGWDGSVRVVAGAEGDLRVFSGL
jgi:competence protein ComEC